MKELKAGHCKMNLSEMVNAILDVFFSKYYVKEVKKLEEVFFDDKSYLKNLLSNSGEKDIKSSLRDYLKKSEKKKKVPSKTQNLEQIFDEK